MRSFGIPWMGAILLGLPALAVGWLADNPMYRFHDERDAALVVMFKQITPRVHECGEEEKKAYLAGRAWRPSHMQKGTGNCGSRERHPLAMRITVDGQPLFDGEIMPSGLRHDAAIFVFERFLVSAGTHRVAIVMRDNGAHGEEYLYSFSEEIAFKPLAIVSIDFEKPRFTIRR